MVGFYVENTHMSCSYSDIAIESFDKKALEYSPPVLCWKRFRDDVFIVCPHSLDELKTFFLLMNTVDQTKKIQFTIEIAEDSL